MYTAVATANATALPTNHLRCVRSISTEVQLLVLLGAGCASSPAKNSGGFTRCAASCGQAYTQLGSAWSWHKSQEVALTRTPAILCPGCAGSSSSAGKGCRLIFP